jgi:adenylate cyclase, class 2
MKIEYEIKVLDIDIDTVKTALSAQGFVQSDEVAFKRYVYTIANDEKSWLRLRTDGKRSTLTLKKFVKDAIDGMEETEVTVDDFDAANSLVEGLGMIAEKYQENRRTIFTKAGTNFEVSIDEWPHIPAYLEIESTSEEDVYARYGLDINAYKVLTFRSAN